MAQHTIGGSTTLNPSSQAPSLHAVLILRWIGGLVALLGAIISFIGTSWDIQWHTLLGRDRTLIPPHIMMLTGITIGGIAALAVIITETVWVRRHTSIAQEFTPFAGLFSGPLGAYIAGYAALNSAVAFPLDTYWHSLYGIDVTLWAPFHIMIITGMALMALGSVYMLASAAHLAINLHERRVERSTYIGMIGAFAASISLFALLVAEGSSPDRSVSLGFASFSLYPVLAALLLGCTLVAATYALPWRWVATSIVGVTFLFAFIDQLFVPPALTWLMHVEQLSYRSGHANPPPVSLVAVSWPLVFIVSAFLIDLCVQRARRKGWSERQLFIGLVLATLIGGIPFNLVKPLAALTLAEHLGVVGILLSLIIGCLGSVVGTKLGQSIGETTHTIER